MGRVTSAAPHLSAEEIARRLKQTVGTREHRRWLIIWNALVDPRAAKEIAKHTGVAENTVHDLLSRYKRFGAQAVESPRLSKRLRCYLSKEEEVIFLSPFLEKAKGGEIATAAEIRLALEELLGHGIHHSTVYRLLERNGWRKVVPRPFHIESRQKVQEDFKKTSQNS
jgi:transposase